MILDISSLYQYGSSYIPAYNTSTSSVAQGSSQTGSDNFSTILGATLSNSDGDTAQLSSSAMAGMPPMMGNDTTASDVNSFMQEVASGTATDTDLKNMETELEQAASSTGSSTSATTSTSTDTAGASDDLMTVFQPSMSQQMLNSAIYAYSNNNVGSSNSTQSMTV